VLQKIIGAYQKNVASMDLVKRLMKDTSVASHLSKSDKLLKMNQHQQVLSGLENKHKMLTDAYHKYSDGKNMARGGINGLKMAQEI
jgi:hypothetical protein